MTTRVDPDSGEFHPALGDPDEIESDHRNLFDSSGFQTKIPPDPGDWLAVHDEPGQTFEQFVASDRRVPGDGRNVIYVQPLGSFEDDAPSLKTLERFGEAYFQMEVTVRAPLDIGGAGITERKNPGTRLTQLLTSDILEHLKKKLPDDAFAMLGVTMTDLYPDPRWNFVFGQASLGDRVGVYSFARYRADDPKLTLLRSLKVMSHETGHMFGMYHCTFFECDMNGSNHLGETDRSPIHLCPICLRKLTSSVAFDPVERYAELARLYRQLGLTEQAEWSKSQNRSVR